MLKKITALLITLFLFFNIGGFLFLFKLQQEIIQNKVKERISTNILDKDLTLFVIYKPDINNGSSKFIWVKEGKEFRYNGKLFDVVRLNKTNDKMYIYCRNDKEEEELFINACIFINKNLSKNHFITRSLPFYLISIFKTIPPLTDTEAVCGFLNNYYKSFLPRVPTPPPRQA